MSGGGCAQILVGLRNADPTALTALASLRSSLGFEGRLTDLRRRVLWELHGPAGTGPEEFDRVIEALRRSGELWNPNKEAAFVRRPGEALTALGRPVPGEETDWTFHLAWDPQRDLDRIPHPLASRRGAGWRLSRGTLWCLRWSAGTAEDRRVWTEEAVVCRGPRRGLLVHPHLEDSRAIGGAGADAEPAPWLPAVPVGSTAGEA